MENPHRRNPELQRGKMLTLAVLAGLLSPAKNFPDGKSRPITLISGNREPHGATPVGHSEPRYTSSELRGGTAQLIAVFHGYGVASESFIASADVDH